MTLQPLINLHADKTCYIVALGNSVNSIKDHLVEESKDKVNNVFITCNNWDRMIDIKADYWMLASTVNTIYHMQSRMSWRDAVVVYENVIDQSKNVEAAIGPHIAYHNYQKDFSLEGLLKDGTMSSASPEEKINARFDIVKRRNCGEKSLQETLRDLSGTPMWSISGSIALAMLSLALIMGCKKIFIAGCDLDYEKGYIDGTGTDYHYIDQHIPHIIEQFGVLKEAGDALGADIVNLSPHEELNNIFRTI